MSIKIAVIGGGAAGFFAALSCKSHHPNSAVVLFEKSNKLLSKVKISGGGRCNVTHACFSINELIKFYPRGAKSLKKTFQQFNTTDTVQWFEDRGVSLKTEPDNRVFPTTDSSQSIIDCILKEANRLNVKIEMHCGVEKIEKKQTSFELLTPNGKLQFDKVIIASGGSPKIQGLNWLQILGHDIIEPVPSLFTFNMPQEGIKKMMGLSVPNATVRIQGTKLQQSGALLITHWGMSGPAVLKTSAWGARDLHDLTYNFNIQINWLGDQNEDGLRNFLNIEILNLAKRKITNKNPFGLPNRLWEYFITKLGISEDTVWAELGKKNTNRIINLLLNDIYAVEGKTTFKEEFVTAGGIKTSEIDFNTMQSKILPGIFFAGEVLDIDGLTGGFNFQAAWSTGFVAGKHCVI